MGYQQQINQKNISAIPPPGATAGLSANAKPGGRYISTLTLGSDATGN